MNKIIRLCVCLGMLLPLCAFSKPQTINVKVELSEDKIKVANCESDSSKVAVLEYEGIDLDHVPLKPMIPVIHKKYLVDTDSKYIYIENLEATATTTIALEYPLVKCPLPETTNGEVWEVDLDEFSIDYEVVKVVEDGFLFGNKHIVTLEIRPFMYDEESNTVSFTKEIEFNLVASAEKPKNMDGIYVSKLSPIDSYYCDEKILSMLVENYERKAETGIPSKMVSPTIYSIPTVGNTNLPAYAYMVVTTRAMEPAFQRLIGWKKQKGYTAGVVCIEDILSDMAFSNGDLISGINDNAGKLRAFLSAAFQCNHGTRFVLLGGTSNYIPLRYSYSSSSQAFGNNYSTSQLTPADLYFSDLNSNWDYDNDGIYGEKAHDHIDFNPEIFVGRLLCTNCQEVENYVEKLICYEVNPGNGDIDYLRRGFLCQSDQMQIGTFDTRVYPNQADTISKLLQNVLVTSTIFEELPSADSPYPYFPTGTQVLDEINTTKYGVLCFNAHGNPYGITTKSFRINGGESYGILSRQGLPNNLTWMQIESGNGVDQLTNYNYPNVLYSASCKLMPFDKLPSYDLYENIGQAFTTIGKYGCAAFIGNTRDGYIINSYLMQKKFFEYLYDFPKIGVETAYQKIFYTGSDIYDYHCKMTNNLLGCPEFSMWVDEPIEPYFIYYNNITQDYEFDSMGGTPASYQGTLIDLNTGHYGLCSVSGNIPNNTFVNNVLTVNSEGFIPKFFPLIIKDNSIFADGSYLVESLIIGKGGMTNLVHDSTFSNCNVIFEVFGDTTLNKGFVMDSGANVTIICHGAVNINGGNLKNGSNLLIRCNNIVMNGHFLKNYGANLTYESLN